MITVVGTGSGKKENLTLNAFNVIKNAKNLVLKTEKMPVKELIEKESIPYITLDNIYENAEDFDDLNKKIADYLSSLDNPVYLVHGSALDDTSVRALKEKNIIPGVSVNDCALAFMNISADAKHYTTFEILNGILPTNHTDSIITGIDSKLLAGEVKCIVAEVFGDEYPINFYTEDFKGNQQKADIMLYELDMQETYNHTTSIFIKKPDFDSVYKYDCQHLTDIMEKLCSKNGCPWDKEQTHESLRQYLIEEAFEVIDAINKDDFYSLYDELGDVLYQVVFHACIGKKCGEFDFSDVTDAISRKMIHRHPHIFAGQAQAGDLNDNWEQLKKEEKGLKTTYDVMNDVPQCMASLMRAKKILFKAEKAGINPPNRQQNIDKITSILNSKETLNENELGEILFEFVKLCRLNSVDPELALHRKITDYIEETAKNP